jgi:hypothetical protein
MSIHPISHPPTTRLIPKVGEERLTIADVLAVVKLRLFKELSVLT